MYLLLEKQQSLSLVDRIHELSSPRDPAGPRPTRSPLHFNTSGLPLNAHADPFYGGRQSLQHMAGQPASTTTGVPTTSIQLGTPQFGLEKIRPADPDIAAVVPYRRYRLQKLESTLALPYQDMVENS